MPDDDFQHERLGWCSGLCSGNLAGLQFEAEGIAAERIDLMPLTPGNKDHLATYSFMDISLDPWPYAGTTTTCESLFMGVPVVSLRGGLPSLLLAFSRPARPSSLSRFSLHGPDSVARLQS